jgi:hypothetical protein
MLMRRSWVLIWNNLPFFSVSRAFSALCIPDYAALQPGVEQNKWYSAALKVIVSRTSQVQKCLRQTIGRLLPLPEPT